MAETVRAANRRAVHALMEQVLSEPITSKVTVASLVQTLGVKEEFTRTFFRADQIGGPRWVDDTVQVQLEIPTEKVVTSLKQLAAARSAQSPVTAAQIEQAAADWPRVFSATGSSALAHSLVEMKPALGDQWARVSDAARQKALAAANIDATRRVMESVSPVVLVNHTTLAEGFANPEVGERVRRWLSQRPVTRVDFRENLQVEVALEVDEHDLFDLVRTTLDQQSAVPIPRSAEDWKRVERDFNARFIPAVGHAAVVTEAPATRVAIAPAPDLPGRTPEWINQQVDVQGTAAGVSGINRKLRTGLAAEHDAMSKLRERIESLPYDKGTTVGEAAKRDPRVAEAVSLTVQRARVYKTIYNSDGSATVKVMADMRDLWDGLRR